MTVATDAEHRARAEESVAQRFTRVMNATPAPWGVLGDLTFASVAAGVVIVAGLALSGHLERPSLLAPTFALAALPLLVATAASIALRGSRARVVDWLASVPFPIENVNALLAGTGDRLEVELAPGAALPERGELQKRLDEVSEQALCTEVDAELRVVKIQLGVVDSKRNPQRTNHERWVRMQAVVERVLLGIGEGTAGSGVERVIVG